MDGERVLRAQPLSTISAAVVGFYAWLVAITFGAVVLDILYARLAPQAGAAFAEAADFLLALGAVTILAGIGAVGLSWPLVTARAFLSASLVVIFIGLLAPAFLTPVLQGAGSQALATGIRLVVTGLPSALAFIGLHRYYREAAFRG